MSSCCSHHRIGQEHLKLDLPITSFLEFYHNKWRKKYDKFHEYASPPWWTPDLVLTPDIHAEYERFLPINEFIDDLQVQLLAVLSGSAYLPQCLNVTDYMSLPDFWRQLPEWLTGRLLWSSEELFAVACALASPASHGAQSGRYPEQIEFLVDWLRHNSCDTIRVLDYGCGTGQGTYELAHALKLPEKKTAIVGITIEYLEAWMASGRVLPHLSHSPLPPQQQYPDYTPAENMDLAFVSGNVFTFLVKQPIDIIVCNGLLGGPYLPLQMKDATVIWKKFQTQLSPGGLLVIGDHFHAGFREQIEGFIKQGIDHLGWKVLLQQDATIILLRPIPD